MSKTSEARNRRPRCESLRRRSKVGSVEQAAEVFVEIFEGVGFVYQEMSAYLARSPGRWTPD